LIKQNERGQARCLHARFLLTATIYVLQKETAVAILAKTTNDLYPDLIALGGLENTLQSALREIGSALTVLELDKDLSLAICACVESGSRYSQVRIAAEERLFFLDFWARGVMLAQGRTPRMDEVAQAIDKWVASSCGTADLAAAFRFVVVEPKAAAYERGEEVEDRWRFYISEIAFPELVPFVEAASRRPQLRYLFPYTSMNTFCFSRCTGYPFTLDTPFVRPVKENWYEVLSASGVVLGRGDAEAAAELVVANLPPGCGPAVPGTADDMGGA
jgi:hypothetical protein